MAAIANMAAATARLDRDLEGLKGIVLEAQSCLPKFFLGRGNFGNQMMYIKNAFTNSKSIVKIFLGVCTMIETTLVENKKFEPVHNPISTGWTTVRLKPLPFSTGCITN
jgi:hypothetical protein